ncbi:MAG: transporter related protein [Firmicutes bacterium]|nr:transporter related protein [Bacillota bacterium]
MVILSCKDIVKSFGVELLLDKVTFNINDGEKIGLIGPNGAGKSSLFKILTGELDYDSGEIFVDKSKTVGYLSQHLSLAPENTVFEELQLVFDDLIRLEQKLHSLENEMNKPYDSENEAFHNKLIKDYTTSSELYMNRGGFVFRAEISKVLKGLGFSEDDSQLRISVLSGGQKTRVALCKLLLIKPDILLLDEPTNHLDLEAIEWLEEYLNVYRGTIILISHDRFFLDSITNKTFELLGGKVNPYNGNYTAFVELKKKDYEIQLKAYNLQKAEIKRQEDIIERYRSFNREKSIKAAESRQRALDKVDRLTAPVKEKKITKINFETQIKSGNDVLHIEGLSKAYDDRVLFEDLNLDIKKGEKIALIGDNGIGKTTLLKIIMGKIPSNSGISVLGKNVFIGYYDQEQSDLDPDKSILDEVWDDFPELSTTQIRSALAAFLFTGDDVFKKVHLLSGGERCRINLLKLMLSKSNFLLLDEPTNHLDIMSREALEDAILGYDGTILLISHDRYFLNKVIEKIIELTRTGLNEYLGNYSYYVEKKKNPLRFQEIEEFSGMTKTQQQNEKRKKRELEKLEKEKKHNLKDIEKRISDLEALLVSLDEKLCLPEVYSNPEECVRINIEISDSKDELDKLYEEWESLM